MAHPGRTNPPPVTDARNRARRPARHTGRLVEFQVVPPPAGRGSPTALGNRVGRGCSSAGGPGPCPVHIDDPAPSRRPRPTPMAACGASHTVYTVGTPTFPAFSDALSDTGFLKPFWFLFYSCPHCPALGSSHRPLTKDPSARSDVLHPCHYRAGRLLAWRNSRRGRADRVTSRLLSLFWVAGSVRLAVSIQHPQTHEQRTPGS